LALYRRRDDLSFVFEHPLNSEPLRIDVVIIKKKPGTVIEDPIGSLFRNVNILEYKSPGDHLSVSDFHKVGAYARLYSAQNRVETADMSVSFVAQAQPRKLLNYLGETYGFAVREQWPGIHYVEGDIFPTQIIESKRLEGGGGGVWLKDLRGGLNGEQLREIIEMSKGMPKGAPLAAYLHTVLQANSRGLREMLAMSEASFEAVLEEYGFTAKWEAKGLVKAVKRLQKHGMEPQQIAEVLELPLDTVVGYLAADFNSEQVAGSR
jgi:hypothetical protein